MHGLTFALTVISAFAPASAGATDTGATASHEKTVMVAQAATTPPPGAMGEPPPPPAYTSTSVAPAPGYTPPPPFAAAPVNRGLSLWALAPYHYGGLGLGLGARYAIPLGIPSLIPGGRIRDNWSLEFGADFFHYSIDYGGGLFGSEYSYSVNQLYPAVGMQWNVWLNDRFAVYPKIEGGYLIGWVSDTSGYSAPSYNAPYVAGIAGLIFKLGETFALRAEVGSFGLKGGISFLF